MQLTSASGLMTTSGKGKVGTDCNCVPSISTSAAKCSEKLTVVQNIYGFSLAETLVSVEMRLSLQKFWPLFKALASHLLENLDTHSSECEVEVPGEGECQSCGSQSYAGGNLGGGETDVDVKKYSEAREGNKPGNPHKKKASVEASTLQLCLLVCCYMLVYGCGFSVKLLVLHVLLT